MPFRKVKAKIDFAALEEEINQAWEHERTFARSIEQRAGGPEFVASYRVYALPRAGERAPLAPHEVAVTEGPRAELVVPAGDAPTIEFYRVTAIDRAGNESAPGGSP